MQLTELGLFSWRRDAERDLIDADKYLQGGCQRMDQALFSGAQRKCFLVASAIKITLLSEEKAVTGTACSQVVHLLRELPARAGRCRSPCGVAYLERNLWEFPIVCEISSSQVLAQPACPKSRLSPPARSSLCVGDARCEGGEFHPLQHPRRSLKVVAG